MNDTHKVGFGWRDVFLLQGGLFAALVETEQLTHYLMCVGQEQK